MKNQQQYSKKVNLKDFEQITALKNEKTDPDTSNTKLVNFINKIRRDKTVDNNAISFFENSDYSEYIELNDDNIFVLLYSDLYFKNNIGREPNDDFYENLNTSNNLSNVVTKNPNLETLGSSIETNETTVQDNIKEQLETNIGQQTYISQAILNELLGPDLVPKTFLPHTKNNDNTILIFDPNIDNDKKNKVLAEIKSYKGGAAGPPAAAEAAAPGPPAGPPAVGPPTAAENWTNVGSLNIEFNNWLDKTDYTQQIKKEFIKKQILINKIVEFLERNLEGTPEFKTENYIKKLSIINEDTPLYKKYNDTETNEAEMNMDYFIYQKFVLGNYGKIMKDQLVNTFKNMGSEMIKGVQDQFNSAKAAIMNVVTDNPDRDHWAIAEMNYKKSKRFGKTLSGCASKIGMGSGDASLYSLDRIIENLSSVVNMSIEYYIRSTFKNSIGLNVAQEIS